MARSRYIVNTGPLAKISDPHNHLLVSLTHIIDSVFPNSGPPVSAALVQESCGQFGGLYKGPTSIAFLFVTLSRYYPDLQIRAKSLIGWAKSFTALIPEDYLVSYKWTNATCGIHNDMFFHAMISGIINRDASVINQICSEVVMDEILKEGPEDEGGGVDEWLYGRAGFLYLLRALKLWFVTIGDGNTATSPGHARKLIDETSNKVIERILITPRPWMIWGSPYLGAAHGAIGIIAQIILTNPSYAPKLEGELWELLALQSERGNWPTQFGKDPESSSTDRLVQFCHGSPGFVITLMSIKEFFTEAKLRARIDAAIERGRAYIWERGLLTKDPNLCHGIAGNALAFDPSDERFSHFVSFLRRENVEEGYQRGIFTRSDSPLGLLCGEAGRTWVWAVADKGLKGGFIGYDAL